MTLPVFVSRPSSSQHRSTTPCRHVAVVRVGVRFCSGEAKRRIILPSTRSHEVSVGVEEFCGSLETVAPLNESEARAFALANVSFFRPREFGPSHRIRSARFAKIAQGISAIRFIDARRVFRSGWRAGRFSWRIDRLEGRYRRNRAAASAEKYQSEQECASDLHGWPATLTARWLDTIGITPSCPRIVLPQHTTRPVVRTAHVWCDPAERCIASFNP